MSFVSLSVCFAEHRIRFLDANERVELCFFFLELVEHNLDLSRTMFITEEADKTVRRDARARMNHFSVSNTLSRLSLTRISKYRGGTKPADGWKLSIGTSRRVNRLCVNSDTLSRRCVAIANVRSRCTRGTWRLLKSKARTRDARDKRPFLFASCAPYARARVRITE